VKILLAGNRRVFMPLQDSGERRAFTSGAVRDIAEGKGRCDLLPLSVISEYMPNPILEQIGNFIADGNPKSLWNALDLFQYEGFPMGVVNTTQRIANTLLEVAKHYEAGCDKYGERNWEKGIPLHCYIDSGVRHYLKYLREDNDEPHNRAFVWNMLGAIWTIENKPEFIDIPAAKEVTSCPIEE